MNASQKSIDAYLAERNPVLDEAIRSLFKMLAAKGKSQSGDAVKGVMAACVEELETNKQFLVDQLVLEKRLYSPRAKDADIRDRLTHHIESRICYLDGLKTRQIKKAIGLTVTERVLEASDLSVPFSRILHDAIVELDTRLLDLKERKGITLKQRLIYELENNWVYLAVICLISVYAAYAQFSG